MTTRAIALTALLVATPAAADPLRLRADALASAESPAGLLVLDASGTSGSYLSAEAVVWLAGQRVPGEDVTGDVLVIALRARDPKGRATGQIGRFVATLGALRPVHLDGASTRVVLPRRFLVEVATGIPVLASQSSETRAWDWVAGGRVARRIGEAGSMGVAYQQERDAGRLAREEVGVDAGVAFDARHDAGGRVAYDLVGRGVAEAGVSASAKRGALRVEAYAQHRSSSHLLPATSLFTVLGDTPSQRAGTVLTWRAAPRLDVIGDLAIRNASDELGEELTLRTRLRLDPKGASALGGELHRSGGANDSAWTGARGSAQLALPRAFGLTAELELVRPDEDRQRGTLWPWALLGLTYKTASWQAAVAIEASATPEYRHRVDAVVQLARLWSVR